MKCQTIFCEEIRNLSGCCLLIMPRALNELVSGLNVNFLVSTISNSRVFLLKIKRE